MRLCPGACELTHLDLEQTMQLRLLNRVGSDLQTMGGVLHGQSAAAMFHDLLFASGLERVLAVSCACQA